MVEVLDLHVVAVDVASTHAVGLHDLAAQRQDFHGEVISDQSTRGLRQRDERRVEVERDLPLGHSRSFRSHPSHHDSSMLYAPTYASDKHYVKMRCRHTYYHATTTHLYVYVKQLS